MPNTKSAKKALRVSNRKRQHNLAAKAKMKSSLKDLRRDIAAGGENVQEILSRVYSTIDKAVKRNILHKNTASRKKSRLVAMIKKMVPDSKPIKKAKSKAAKPTSTKAKTTSKKSATKTKKSVSKKAEK